MSGQPHDEELAVEHTEGFKVSEKKTIDEYQKLDANDESLNKWKASLGLGTGTPISDPKDPRKVVMLSLGLEVQDRPDIVISLEAPTTDAQKKLVNELKTHPFTIKEGAVFRMKVRFRVQHDVLSGMKYVQNVKRGPLSDKHQEMIGSYSPNTTDKPEYEKKLEADTAPSGMLSRGKYTATSRFVDDDNQEHLKFEWSFEIKKEW